MRTIAEFVGDDDTVLILRRLGVDFGQGYHLGHPERLETLLGVPVARTSTLDSGGLGLPVEHAGERIPVGHLELAVRVAQVELHGLA